MKKRSGRRKPTVKFPVYHVNRICWPQVDLNDPFHLRVVGQTLDEAGRKFGYLERGRSIGGNRMDLYIQELSGREEVSRIMQWINSRIAREHNREYNTFGPFWISKLKIQELTLEEFKNVKFTTVPGLPPGFEFPEEEGIVPVPGMENTYAVTLDLSKSGFSI